MAARVANDADSGALVSLDRAVGANAGTIYRPPMGLTVYRLEGVTIHAIVRGLEKKDEQRRERPRRKVPPANRFVIHVGRHQ